MNMYFDCQWRRRVLIDRAVFVLPGPSILRFSTTHRIPLRQLLGSVPLFSPLAGKSHFCFIENHSVKSLHYYVLLKSLLLWWLAISLIIMSNHLCTVLNVIVIASTIRNFWYWLLRNLFIFVNRIRKIDTTDLTFWLEPSLLSSIVKNGGVSLILVSGSIVECCFQETNGWPMQLLSVACLSLAAKMEEPLVPSFLDLQVLLFNSLVQKFLPFRYIVIISLFRLIKLKKLNGIIVDWRSKIYIRT